MDGGWHRMLRALALLLLLGAAWLLPWQPAHARRLALVIGNDTYQFAEKLANARNDADAMAKSLQAAGFAVTRHHDLAREPLFRAVDSFVLSVKKDDQVVVFYSGHGVQIDSAAYLLPVDIQADSPRQITRNALALDTLVNDLSKARYALVVVDACRNNPFAVQGRRAIGAERGLAPIEPPEGVAIILSAARGQTALDNLGPNDRERNGVFTREFLRHMNTPGLQVRDLLLRVRDSVEQQAAAINHKQRPALVDESRGQFFFYPPASASVASAGASARPEAEPSDKSATERAYWRSVETSGSAEELRLYLQRYPKGRFADLAQARLARLEKGNDAPAGVAKPANAANPPSAADPAGDTEARKLRESAQKGSAAAAFSLGAAYFDGRMGLAKDESQAALWYRKAADAGNARAMSNLGAMYLVGRGGLPKDDAQALALLRKSADAGEGRAMNQLGNLYANGLAGLAKDKAAARDWYERAVATGNEMARSNLAKLK